MKTMLGKPGPFQIVNDIPQSGTIDKPGAPPRRRYACDSYDICLDLAVALNWDNFTCRGCCGEVNESLIWRACQARRKDQVADQLCNLAKPRASKNKTVIPITSHALFEKQSKSSS